MLIRIVKAGPGCAFQPGQVLKTNESRAQYLIDTGFAEPVGVVDNMRIVNTGPAPVSNKPMQPPRHICGCGLVCKSADALEEHRKNC